MANLTDPLARSLHGTNPQNLIEYITRQKIYDSHFWKDECFGLTAADATEKAATRISCIGGKCNAAYLFLMLSHWNTFSFLLNRIIWRKHETNSVHFFNVKIASNSTE